MPGNFDGNNEMNTNHVIELLNKPEGPSVTDLDTVVRMCKEEIIRKKKEADILDLLVCLDEWAESMGGWVSPVWDRVKPMIRRLRNESS